MKKKITRNKEGISSKVSIKIRSIRRGVGMTQKKLADILSITPQQIASYEGCLTHLTLERFLEITTILKTDPIQLLQSCLSDNNVENHNSLQGGQVNNSDYDKAVKLMKLMNAIEGLNSN